MLVGSDPVDEPLAGLAAKVREDATRITDADVVALLAGGLAEDRVLEVTLAAAVTAASVRLAAGLGAMHAGKPDVGPD